MNILTEALIRIETRDGIEWMSLPGVYAALVADRVESFPALRPHQVPAWHMFLAQLGAIAVHRAGLPEPPADAAEWLRIIRDLTKDEFPDGEPWCLVVEDSSMPAFLQPPVPKDLVLKNEIGTPDELDMVITAKDHDLKQAVAAHAEQDDWIFALVSLQTGEGYNGSGNYGIARMNGGSSSRVCLGLTPMPQATSEGTCSRQGPRLRRDMTQLLVRRRELLDRVPNYFPEVGGRALIWTGPWPEGELLSIGELDIWFVEVCRRVRLSRNGPRIIARSGTSTKRRIDAEQFRGVVGDPWAPVHRTDLKALTLGDAGEFDYRKLIELFSPEWELPILATLGPGENDEAANWLLVAQAFARGNSRTGGFKERIIPLKGRIAKKLGSRRFELHQIAQNQITEIETIEKVLRDAIAIAAAGGDFERVNEQAYEKTRPARRRLKLEADRLFFSALWDRFEAEEDRDEPRRKTVRKKFVIELRDIAIALLDEALADQPCPSMRRPRAEARARRQFWSQLRRGFPEYFAIGAEAEDTAHAL